MFRAGLNFRSAARIGALALAAASLATGARAQSAGSSWVAGGWSLTLGATGFLAPRFQGSDKLAFYALPMVSLSRTGSATRFSSRNDGISFAFVDTGVFRAGPVGKILFARTDSDRDLRGLGTVPWGGELGAFADVYPTGWLRLRAEIRHGIRAHHGVIADLSADAFHDLNATWRISAGPRLSLATRDYFRAYYGVNAAQSGASGLPVYNPGGGVRAIGFGGALTWKATDKITTSLFAEYARLLGPAASSSLVRQRGSTNQFTIGASATYRFDFSL